MTCMLVTYGRLKSCVWSDGVHEDVEFQRVKTMVLKVSKQPSDQESRV